MRKTIISVLHKALALLIASSWSVLLVPEAARAQSPEQYSSFIQGVTFGASNYRYFALPSPHSSLCAEACYRDRRCSAWTYQSPESRGDNTPLCYLHPRVYSQTANGCCTSGLIYGRSAGPGPGPGRPPNSGELEPGQYSTFIAGVTLGASNYRQLTLPSPHSSLCARACFDDRRCVAWTYQTPESNGQNVPFCYLHTYAPRRTANACCTSGWIRGRGARF